jgi:putative transposase
MRIARIRRESQGTFYHVMNRAAGTRADRPFGDREREYFVRLIQRLSTLYTVEIVSYCVMSNHFHLVLFSPSELPTIEDTVTRYNSYYEGKKSIEEDAPEIEIVRARLRDMSCFLKDLQQLFTGWYNKSRSIRRRGSLWADRFKSVMLDGETALWSCIKYVELNAVRAGIVEDPADYRFCSWGVWAQSGKHPFGKAFFRHVRRSCGSRAKEWSLRRLQSELRADMARTIAAESGASGEEIREAHEAALKRPPLVLQATRRLRYWNDGAVIGSKLFVQGIAAELYGSERAAKRRYGKGLLPETATAIFSLRCLRGELQGSPQEQARSVP